MTFSKEEKYSDSEAPGLGGEIKNNIKKYVLGLVFGFCAMVLAVVIFSALMTLNAVPDSFTSVFGYIAAAIGCFVAGLVSVKLIGTNGLMNGIIMGVIFFILHMILFFALGQGGFSVSIFIYLAIELLCACFGGITAVNTK